MSIQAPYLREKPAQHKIMKIFSKKSVDNNEIPLYNSQCCKARRPWENVSLAQLVEHLTLNQQVRSSSLRWDTI